MNNQKQKAIKSAESVAALRASTYRDKDSKLRGSDNLAHLFLGTRNRLFTSIRPHSLLKKLYHRIFPGGYYFSITRTRHFDHVLIEEIEEGIQQLVILGAGYDTRAFRFNEKLKDVEVYEVDFQATQLYKHKIIKKEVKVIPSNIHFIPVDFNNEIFQEKLADNGFSNNKKTLFLWEGVSYYLPEKVVKSVLSYVGTCEKGSSVIFDYSLEQFVNGNHSTYGGKEIAKWLKKIKEPFLFGLAPENTATFLEDCNLKLKSDLGSDELDKMYLVNEQGKVAGKSLGHVRMAYAHV